MKALQRRVRKTKWGGETRRGRLFFTHRKSGFGSSSRKRTGASDFVQNVTSDKLVLSSSKTVWKTQSRREGWTQPRDCEGHRSKKYATCRLP